jgi:hypothetical protein
MEFYIWFNLLMFHAGQVYWINTFDSQDDCQFIQHVYEEKYPKNEFSCPFVRVNKT